MKKNTGTKPIPRVQLLSQSNMLGKIEYTLEYKLGKKD